MHAKNMSDASATPANDRFPRFALRYHAHRPAAGKNESREVPFKAISPHNTPNPTQARQPSWSSSRSASQNAVASSKAERLVSHTARVHQNITLGNKAHAHAEPTATFSENTRLPIRKIGMQVRAEQALFTVSSTKAEAFE